MRSILLTATALLLALPPAHAGDDAAADPVQKMQAVYDETEAFSASFKQVYTPKGLPHRKRSKGKVYFRKPGHMRWDYHKPEPKLFVADGKSLYVYTPVDKQVMVTSNIDQKLSSAISFLFGKGDLRRDFEVSVVDPKKTRYGKPTDIVLRAVPRKDEGHVRDIHFVLDPKTHMVRETVVIDPLGNKNHLRFSDIELNPKLDAALFRFDIPEGVEVIRPPGQ